MEVYVMRVNDYMDMESARAKAIEQLAEICAAMGLSWSATEKEFTIQLPDVISQSVVAQVSFSGTTRKSFDITKWGPIGPVEGATTYKSDDSLLPDDMQLPDYGEILEEGEPPKGDKDAEA